MAQFVLKYAWWWLRVCLTYLSTYTTIKHPTSNSFVALCGNLWLGPRPGELCATKDRAQPIRLSMVARRILAAAPFFRMLLLTSCHGIRSTCLYGIHGRFPNQAFRPIVNYDTLQMLSQFFLPSKFVRQRKRRWFSTHGMAVFFFKPVLTQNQRTSQFSSELELYIYIYILLTKTLTMAPFWKIHGSFMAFQILLQNPTSFISEKPFARLLRERRGELMEMLPSVKA